MILQQWVRDYMQVFVRYNDILKRARVRQFLYEGAWNGNMAIVVECIPALIHVSLSLFFIGLADFLFVINDRVAIAAASVIACSGILYIACMVSPVANAQSPYQTPPSGIFWWIAQKLQGRHHGTASGSERKPVSTNLTDGRVQLAMDESIDRKERDARAIVWVIDNLTEDSELEPFVEGIPGSIYSPWGRVAEQRQPSPEMHKCHGEFKRQTAHCRTSTPDLSPHTVMDLSNRINRLLKTCTDPGVLVAQARWRRARACIDAALSLVLGVRGTNSFLDQQVMAQALVYLGCQSQDPTNLKPAVSGQPDGANRALMEQGAGYDNVFAAKWTCMTIMSTYQMLQDKEITKAASKVIAKLAEARGEVKDVVEVAEKMAVIMDKQVSKAWKAALELHKLLVKDKAADPDKMEQLVNTVMKEDKEHLARSSLHGMLSAVPTSHGYHRRCPRTLTWCGHRVADRRKTPLNVKVQENPKWMMPQPLPTRLLAQRLQLSTWNLKTLAASDWTVTDEDRLKALVELSAKELEVPQLQKLMETPTPFEAQLWRLQDIRDGGMAFMVDLFIAAFRSHTQISQESHQLFRNTLQTLTANREKAQLKDGTKRYLVAILKEVLPKTEKSPDGLPAYIVDPMLDLVGDVLIGVKDRYVGDAANAISDYLDILPENERARDALKKISPGGGSR
ncbi:hypothetical protein EW146_g6554 [Bondarzewia mesenterica]|uniref:DUF6535 domain-containing protein n=1 Tax=Bondarzewia mesenterica TaxID=1095465 RepID=A0A4S4LN93_9AGAM|nr:hypothetical protein EW146_g6554 [Bondarzewia mesenterica]